jgi:hypothetical protein
LNLGPHKSEAGMATWGQGAVAYNNENINKLTSPLYNDVCIKYSAL